MRKIILIINLLIMSILVNAQDFQKVKDAKLITIKFDFEDVQITKPKGMTLDDAKVIYQKEWTTTLERQKKWCIGSLNDDLKGKLVFFDNNDYEIQLILKVRFITADINKPICDAIFVDNSGTELYKYEGLTEDDFNDIGHKFAAILKKQLKK
ncbi:MAG: hypothetical protein MJ211_00325 [Bacteroidales bacterium]|nr:hypothetical protein [Bacteroidales bacterium]